MPPEATKEALLLAIKKFCFRCAPDGNLYDCLDEKCVLCKIMHNNFVTKRIKTGGLLVKIRSRCIECMGDQPHFVPDCKAKKCPLWPWRMGNSTSFGASDEGFGDDLWQNLFG